MGFTQYSNLYKNTLARENLLGERGLNYYCTKTLRNRTPSNILL